MVTVMITVDRRSGLGGAWRAVQAMVREDARQLAERIADEAAQRAPEVSGDLGDSVQAIRTRRGAAIVARKRYASFVELGTRRTNQHRFLLPAVDAVGPLNGSVGL